jgi:excisionase family DNA binding protein
MTENMYSAEEAARILGLQVRTVRNYVREGRLPGVRIGKQYRIARADLEAFTAGAAGGGPGGGDEPEAAQHLPSRPDAEASCVVQIEGIAGEDSERLQRTLTAAALSNQSEGTVLRVEPLYDEERRRLKLIIVGSLSASTELLRVIELFSLDRR